MRTSHILFFVFLTALFAACTALQDNHEVSQRVHAKYPDAVVQIAYHSDGTRGLVVSFEVESFSDLRKSDPLEKAREIAVWMNDWHDNGKPWKDVTVNYKRSLLGNIFTVTSNETVEIRSLHSI